MSEGAFNLLAVPLKHALWRMGWTELRPLQESAIRAVLQSDDDLILSAHTAAGKTEAAFLPILSRLFEKPEDSVSVIYVSPLKALINDQFRRLDELCEHAEIPVHRWHGDVGQAAKQRLVNDPRGVLLITPESLESLFINRSSALGRVMSHLQFVVLDELHAFVGHERGLHLRSLLFRLSQKLECDYRLVALSATLGQWADAYAEWLRPAAPSRVTILSDSGDERAIRLRIYAYEIGQTPEVGEQARGDDIDDEADRAGVITDMFRAFAGKKNLVFANRRDQVEWFADALNERCRRSGRPTEFLVHHGSVSKEVREFTESAMRSSTPHTTLCSSTLELGIDIGSVEEIGQIGAPWSVSSLVQRLGRSGRRDGAASKMRIFVEDYPLTDKSSLVDRLRPELLQSIALTELMLDKWIEPPEVGAFDLSTFTQQVLSVLTETGGISATHLFDRLSHKGAFGYVTPALFKQVLRSLADHQLIEQMAEGDLILGIEGERVVKRLDFYSAFASEKEFAVLHAGRLIGTLPATDPPPAGEHVLLAGRRWRVIAVDLECEEISVEPALGKKLPRFNGSGGNVHAVVRNKMREVLFSDRPIAYLSQQAESWLAHARGTATEAGLACSPWVEVSPSQCLLFTWTGTKVQRTLLLLATAAKLTACDRGIAIEFNAGIQRVRSAFDKISSKPPSPSQLTQLVPFKQRRKFDRYLNDDLLAASLERDALDIDAGLAIIEAAN